MEKYKNKFTYSEYKLYNYINKQLDKVIYLTISDIALECNVGEATVLRFCRKLDYKGYQEFKFAVAKELSSYESDSNNDDNYIYKVKNQMKQTIKDTYELVCPYSLQKAINIILHADSIIIYGISSSGIAALDMQNSLMFIGINVEVITDSYDQIIRANFIKRNSVIIAVSLIGSMKDIIYATKIAKSKGASIISITNYKESSLTRFSDITLFTSAKEYPLDNGAFVSKVSQLFIMDLLCTGIMIEKQKKNNL